MGMTKALAILLLFASVFGSPEEEIEISSYEKSKRAEEERERARESLELSIQLLNDEIRKSLASEVLSALML